MNNNFINSILKINLEDQNFYLRYLSRLPLSIILEILSDQKKIFHKLRQNYGKEELTVLSYCALIMSIQKAKKEEENFEKKDISNLSLDEISDALCKRIAIFTKKEINRTYRKREKLLHYWAIVKVLKKEKKFSFRKISNFLNNQYRFLISHTEIQKMWNELERKEI